MTKLFKSTLLLACFFGCLSACKNDDVDEQRPAVILPVEQAFSTGLPVVVINTPDSRPIVSKVDWVKNADISIVYPDGRKQQFTKASIRGRGNVTWARYPKKSFGLKLDKKAGLGGMKADKRWVLLANWGDRTLLRNAVAFEIARHTSLAWTPSGTFVELVLNGVYNGCYYLCEKIQTGENRLDITEMTRADEDEVGITGGYLMEIDSYFEEDNRFRSAVYQLPYEFCTPDFETLTDKMFDYMERYVNHVEQLLADDRALQNGSYRQYIDLQSFADWWIVNELCYNLDVSKAKSLYVYKDRGCPLMAGPVWDFDFATFTPETDIIVAQTFPYIQRLLLTPDFCRVVRERWNVLRPLLDDIPAYIDAKAKLLSVSEANNILMWPVTDKTTNGDELLSYPEAIDRMKQSFLLRLQVLDEFIRRLSD